MKNNILYKFIVILVILIFIFLSGIQKVYANSNFAIWGYIKDDEGKAKEGVTIRVVGTSYSTTTDAEGYYEITGLEQGNYTLEYDYENSGNIYDTESAQMFQFDKYTDKLEIALVHSEEENVDDYIKQVKNIVKEQSSGTTNSPRILDLKYTTENELRGIISNLKNDGWYEDAFHKAHIAGWKSLATIFYTQNIEYQASHVRPLNNNVYDVLIKPYNANNEDIIKAIYNKIMQKDAEQTELEFADNNNKMKTSVNLRKDTMINVKLKRSTTGLTINDEYDGFIRGNVIANNALITEPLKITLVKDTGEKVTRTTENGEYKFGYPGAGRYRIEFEFDTTNINGQNFEVDSNYTSINNTTSPMQNSVNPSNTNIQDIKQKFSKIGYVEEVKLNNADDCELNGYTDWFYISNTNNNKYGGIILKEREKFSVTLNSEVSAFKVVLGNGQVFAEWNKEDRQDVNNVLTTNSNGSFIITMDNEIRYGAVMQIEYAITATNNSGIKCKGFTIVSGNDLKYESTAKLLTDANITNNDIGWSGIEDFSKYVSENLDSSKVKNNYIKLKDEEGIDSGQSKTYRLVVSNVIDSNCTYYNATELVEYKNDEGRRNFNINGEKIIAGNYWNIGISENDTGISQALLIMPPFGENKGKVIIAVFLIILLIINVIYNNQKNAKNINKRGKY